LTDISVFGYQPLSPRRKTETEIPRSVAVLNRPTVHSALPPCSTLLNQSERRSSTKGPNCKEIRYIQPRNQSKVLGNIVSALPSSVDECWRVKQIEAWFVALCQVRFDGCTHVCGLASWISLLATYEGRWLVRYAKVSRYPISLNIEDDSHQAWACRDKCLENLVCSNLHHVMHSEHAHLYAHGFTLFELVARWVDIEVEDLESGGPSETILGYC
jgi:hypothetical protein